MNFDSVAGAFIRALRASFSPRQLLIAGVALFSLCFTVALFVSIAGLGGDWLQSGVSLFLLSFLFAVLQVTGVFICAGYRDLIEIDANVELDFRRLQHPVFQATVCAAPFLFIHIGVSTLTGLIVLFTKLPWFGGLIGALSSGFVLFLNISSVLGLLLQFTLLFFMPPAFLTEPASWRELAMRVQRRLHVLPLADFLFFFLSALPLIVCSVVLIFSYTLLPSAVLFDGFFLRLLGTTSLAIPALLLLSFPVCFFFHFSFEAVELLRTHANNGVKDDESADL